MSLLCPAGESIRAEYWFSARPLFRKRAGRSSNACVVRVLSATWAWVDQRIPARVHRRWQLAAEVGGGVGLFFRPITAEREPVWADLRLLVTPQAGGQGDTRRMNIEVLYRRGGLGGSTQAWEIDHAAGLVRLVPEVADPASCEAQGPSLTDRSLCCSPARISGLRLPSAASKAERLGLRIGQPLAEAKALLPKAVFLPADFAADRDALCQLALDCQRFSPLVGLEEAALPESLFCEVTGCTHLWDGEEPFLQAVRSYWRERGYHIQLALASTLGAAWALAHTSEIVARAAGDEEVGFLGPARGGAAVAACRPRAPGRRWDFGRLATCLRLPRETLASRFGVILPQRLDQALGLLPKPSSASGSRSRSRSSASGKCRSTIALALASLCRQMLGELLSMAGRLGMGLQELEGELEPRPVRSRSKSRLVEPTRDERHLAQLVELQLERRTWSGGVVAVRWTALRLGRSEQAQGLLVRRRFRGEILEGIQQPGRSAQQPPGCQSGAASGDPCRRTARARGPARSVDELETIQDGHVHVTPGTVSRPSLPAPGHPSAD